MSKILELRSKRNALWEQTKSIPGEEPRRERPCGPGSRGTVQQDGTGGQRPGAEIERLEQQAQLDAQLAAPTSTPVHGTPRGGTPKDKNPRPTATDEYRGRLLEHDPCPWELRRDPQCPVHRPGL